jgi:hypothetical protein
MCGVVNVHIINEFHRLCGSCICCRYIVKASTEDHIIWLCDRCLVVILLNVSIFQIKKLTCNGLAFLLTVFIFYRYQDLE